MENSHPAKAGGLFLSHSKEAAIGAHYVRLRHETRGLIDWTPLFDPANRLRRDRRFAQRARRLMADRYDLARRQVNMMGGFLDLPIITAALALGATHVWVCEYDVDWSGDWGRFFRTFDGNDADLLTTTIWPHAQSRSWHHWQGAFAPLEAPQDRWLRAFHPIMRLSRPLMLRYAQAMSEPGWGGHYEFLLPTVARHFGFSIEDIGGDGPFCPASRRGRLYRNTHSERDLSPGTFVWRPALDRYWSQTDPRLEPDMLHHPVKTGVAEWEVVRQRNEAAFDALRTDLRRGRVVPAMRAATEAQPSYLLAKLVTKLKG